MLFIVATPIGNLEDITYRAIRILKEVDMIVCEDTRKTRILLQKYEIKNSLGSYHSYSSSEKEDNILNECKNGKKIALVSDAGTPGFSDPGYRLVQKAISLFIVVVPIPGVNAFSTALMVSGMQMNHFLYLGFLPIKKGRKTLFERLQKEQTETIVIYESVHRLVKTLGDIEIYFGKDHYIVIGRELTKKFEEYIRGEVGDIKEKFQNNEYTLKGEFVILF